MIKAAQARGTTSSKASSPRMSTEDYLSSRVQSAIDGGYRSTKAWIDADQLGEATAILTDNGYKVDVLQEDKNRRQLSISWE